MARFWSGIASGAMRATDNYLDQASVRRALEEYRANPMAAGGKNSIQLFVAANLALWLERTKLADRKPGEDTHSVARPATAAARYESDALARPNIASGLPLGKGA